jgi:hypothetical protein
MEMTGIGHLHVPASLANIECITVLAALIATYLN